MKSQQTLSRGYLLPRAATLFVLVTIMGCGSGRDTDSIDATPTMPAPEEGAAGASRPDYTDRVTTDRMSRDDMDGTAMDRNDMDRDASRTTGEAGSTTQDSMPQSARAEVWPTIHGTAEGTVTFELGEGDSPMMQVTVDLRGLEPGPHGFHIHEMGDCSADDASSAGGHFSPQNGAHGSPDAAESHAGDMGNLEADQNGRVATEMTLQGVTFSGPTSILEKAVVIHSGRDDLETQPDGDSGNRVGCGVIQSDRVGSLQGT